MKKQFEQFRPKEFTGNGDKYLFPLISELSKVILHLEKGYFYDTLKLDKNQNFVMANLVIELAEDLHNDIGLWKSIEHNNKTLFNTPLPLFVDDNIEIRECFDKNRIKFFVYNIFPEFNDEVILSPYHKDLEILANGVSLFLQDKFKNVPKESGIMLFLLQKDEFGWDLKRKLVWVVLNSYLFRNSCYRYATKNNGGKMDIETIDDFICQENTIWSGLGVIDILAEALKLPEKTQHEVRSWYERLVAIYKVVSLKNNILEVENIITEQKYLVRTFTEDNIFKKDYFVFGGIVPYDDYYYWSGVQRGLGKLNFKQLQKLKGDFVLKSSSIVYRYDKELLSKAQESVKSLYEEFKSYLKDDLVYFKDGFSMAAAFQMKEKQKYDALSKDELTKIMKENNLKNPFPNMNLSADLLNYEKGIGVFFNPTEGMEIMMGFDDITNGFRKNGQNLTNDEIIAIQELIFSTSISPAFVHRIIAQYGHKSIASSFLISTDINCIEFLLHKYKGHFFRNRYPSISIKIN